MTNWQAVREWTAEAVMGWTLQIIDGTVSREREWFEGGHFVMAADDWEPHEHWHHCGMVIEAMQAKGWLSTKHTYDKGALCRYHHGIDRNCKMIDMREASGDTELRAVTLAAAIATGYQEANDG